MPTAHQLDWFVCGPTNGLADDADWAPSDGSRPLSGASSNEQSIVGERARPAQRKLASERAQPPPPPPRASGKGETDTAGRVWAARDQSPLLRQKQAHKLIGSLPPARYIGFAGANLSSLPSELSGAEFGWLLVGSASARQRGRCHLEGDEIRDKGVLQAASCV